VSVMDDQTLGKKDAATANRRKYIFEVWAG
jgi:hypothetical protein